MFLASISGARILGLWLAALLLAVAVVQLGDRLALSHGRAFGFYIGSLFVWILWLAWLLTWRWTAARPAVISSRQRTWLRVLLAVFAVLWLAATVLEYL